MTDFVLDDDSDLGPAGETVLPSFAVLARFQQAAGSEDEAVQVVRRMLTDASEPFDDVALERQEGDGTWMVTARFVVVSVDSLTAVAGVHETLRRQGLAVDEVWVDAQLP